VRGVGYMFVPPKNWSTIPTRCLRLPVIQWGPIVVTSGARNGRLGQNRRCRQRL